MNKMLDLLGDNTLARYLSLLVEIEENEKIDLCLPYFIQIRHFFFKRAYLCDAEGKYFSSLVNLIVSTCREKYSGK